MTAIESNVKTSLEMQHTFQDPAVPMIALPTRFTSHRVNRDQRMPKGGSIDLANLKGAGCVRHIWILFGQEVRLEINVDNAKKSQVDLPLKAFFGIMHDWEPYFVDNAAYTVLPNPEAKAKDPLIPGNPGYNLFLPIPFSESCRITLHVPPGHTAAAMVDWHRYDQGTPLTPYRLHTEHHLYQPSPPRGGFVKMANLDGEGFVAGVAVGYLQRDHSDMVFHTGGMTILLDGETNPHAIRGHNVEDDFGYSWGFNNYQSRWIGSPYHVNRSRTDQDGVFYRFFGPDPIAFRRSLSFRTGSRGDDMESVVYYYQVPESLVQSNINEIGSSILIPAEWQVTGLFPQANNWDIFQQSEFVEQLPTGAWPDQLVLDNQSLSVTILRSDHAWIDLQNVFFERDHTATPRAMIDHSAYARTNVKSDSKREASLRLAVDGWCLVWLNSEKVATLRHENGLETARIPVQLEKGSNELLVKTNNSNIPPNKRLWVINAAIEV